MRSKVFCGISVSPPLKVLLESEAERRGVSMSILAEEILQRGLKHAKPNPRLDPKRSWKKGRKAATRAQVHPEFRAALLNIDNRDAVVRAAGYASEDALLVQLRHTEILLTPKTKARLEELARLIHFNGHLLVQKEVA